MFLIVTATTTTSFRRWRKLCNSGLAKIVIEVLVFSFRLPPSSRTLEKGCKVWKEMSHWSTKSQGVLKFKHKAVLEALSPSDINTSVCNQYLYQEIEIKK